MKNNREELIDIKKFFFTVVNNWYFFILSILICYSIAFLVNRYSKDIFSVSATILIEDNLKGVVNDPGQVLFNNEVLVPAKNMNNQMILLKSYNLTKKTVQDLGFDISYFIKGAIKTVERNYESPFYIVFFDKSKIQNIKGFRVSLSFEDNLSYHLESPFLDNGVYFFGDTIIFKDVSFTIVSDDDKYDFNKSSNVPDVDIVVNDIDYISRHYQNKLNIQKLKKDASVLKLGSIGEDKVKESNYLNQLIVNYISRGLDEKNSSSQNTILFIDEQLQKHKDSLDYFDVRMKDFKSNNKVNEDNISDKANKLYDELVKKDSKVSNLRIQNKYFSYLIDYLENKENYDDIVIPNSYGISDDVLNKLISSLVEKQIDKNLLNSDLLIENPAIKRLNDEISELRSSILQIVKNQKNANYVVIKDLDNQRYIASNKIGSLPAIEKEYLSIKRDREVFSELYSFLLQKKVEAGIAGAANVPDNKVVTNANPKLAVLVSPNKRRNFLISLLLGFFLPTLVFFIREILNENIVSKSDLDRITDIPFLGIIGRNDSAKDNIVYSKPKSKISESLRSIRSNLEFMLYENKSNIIMITSSISGEGKTFIANNLATIYAMSGKKTLLVGCDLRRAKLHKEFNIENDKGVSTVLTKKHSLSDCIKDTGIDNLSILSSGPSPPNPGELLSGVQVERLFENIKQKYDVVIVDTAPLGLVADSMMISKFVDSTVFVVRQNYTKRNLLKYVDDLYQNKKLSNISLVLNDSVVGSGAYGYGYVYGYGYGYGYGQAYGANYGDNDGYYDEDEEKL